MQAAVAHADAYRGYSGALELVASRKVKGEEALRAVANISHYLYESGNVHWLELCGLPVEQFSHAFDASCAKKAA